MSPFTPLNSKQTNLSPQLPAADPMQDTSSNAWPPQGFEPPPLPSTGLTGKQIQRFHDSTFSPEFMALPSNLQLTVAKNYLHFNAPAWVRLSSQNLRDRVAQQFLDESLQRTPGERAYEIGHEWGPGAGSLAGALVAAPAATAFMNLGLLPQAVAIESAGSAAGAALAKSAIERLKPVLTNLPADPWSKTGKEAGEEALLGATFTAVPSAALKAGGRLRRSFMAPEALSPEVQATQEVLGKGVPLTYTQMSGEHGPPGVVSLLENVYRYGIGSQGVARQLDRDQQLAWLRAWGENLESYGITRTNSDIGRWFYEKYGVSLTKAHEAITQQHAVVQQLGLALPYIDTRAIIKVLPATNDKSEFAQIFANVHIPAQEATAVRGALPAHSGTQELKQVLGIGPGQLHTASFEDLNRMKSALQQVARDITKNPQADPNTRTAGVRIGKIVDVIRDTMDQALVKAETNAARRGGAPLRHNFSELRTQYKDYLKANVDLYEGLKVPFFVQLVKDMEYEPSFLTQVLLAPHQVDKLALVKEEMPEAWNATQARLFSGIIEQHAEIKSLALAKPFKQALDEGQVLRVNAGKIKQFLDNMDDHQRVLLLTDAAGHESAQAQAFLRFVAALEVLEKKPAGLGKLSVSLKQAGALTDVGHSQEKIASLIIAPAVLARLVMNPKVLNNVSKGLLGGRLTETARLVSTAMAVGMMDDVLLNDEAVMDAAVKNVLKPLQTTIKTAQEAGEAYIQYSPMSIPSMVNALRSAPLSWSSAPPPAAPSTPPGK